MQEKLDKELKNTTKDPLLAQLQGYNFMYKNMLHQLELEDQIRSSIQK
jgi:hypothetical protein